MGQFRPGNRGLQPDLFDDRRSARRSPRPDLATHRRPALYHDRNQPGEAAGGSGAGRCRAGVQAAVSGELQHRPARNQSSFRRDQPAGKRRHSGALAHRHGGPRRQHRAAAAVCDDRADPQRAAADVHGRKIRPRSGVGRSLCDRSSPSPDLGRCGALRSRDSAQAAYDA